MVSYFLLTSVLAIPISAYLVRNFFSSSKSVAIPLPIEKMTSILVLGGSYAGVSTAHRLLKKHPNVKITLVTPNDSVYWNLAAPRAVVPGGFADDKLFAPTAPGFKQYGARFDFVLGTAEAWDPTAKTVRVSTEGGEKTFGYEILILATGTRTRDGAPYKGQGSTKDTIASLHGFQGKIGKAESIAIVGGGATGVETAGELGSQYGKGKKITLITSGPTVLEGTPASVSKTALSQLASHSVTVKTSTKVTSHVLLPSGQTELTLSDDTKLVADLYLPTTGLVPNSGYIPQELRDQNGFVKVDEFLRVEGTTDAWAVGDINPVQRPQYINTEKQSAAVAKNIGQVLAGQAPTKYVAGGSEIIAVPTGRKSGTGHFGSFKFPSFVVNTMKGKTYFTQNLPKLVAGAGL